MKESAQAQRQRGARRPAQRTRRTYRPAICHTPGLRIGRRAGRGTKRLPIRPVQLPAAGAAPAIACLLACALALSLAWTAPLICGPAAPAPALAEPAVADLSTPIAHEGSAVVGAGRYALHADGTATFAKLAGKKRASLTIPEAVRVKGYAYRVTAIAARACAKAPKLKKVTVKAQVKTIGKKAFSGCGKLAKVTVKSKVLSSLGAQSFANCPRLETFTCASRIGVSALRKAGVL